MASSEGALISEIRIRYHGPVPGTENLSKSVLDALIARAWEVGGHLWARHMCPKHFTHGGAREYGYTPRKGEQSGQSGKTYWRSYTGRKQKLMHHTLPLVWSGQLRAAARIYSLDVRITSTRSRLWVNLPAAGRARIRNPHSQINMAEELTRVSAAEAREIVAAFNGEFAARLGEIQTTEIKTIK